MIVDHRGGGLARALRPCVAAAAAAAVVGWGVLVTGAAPAAADDIRGRQWWLQALDLPAAHRISQGAGVTVAVIDGGVDPRQPDLTGSVVEGTDVLKGKGDGFDDPNGHGTGMAAIIAGHGHGPGNADGILGIAPQAKIMPIKVIGDREDGINDGEFAVAVNAAVARGAKVISVSLDVAGGRESMEAVAQAVDKDVVIVASTGNAEGVALQVTGAPARYRGVVAVGGTDRRGQRAAFSVEGSRENDLMVVAPAVDGINANPDGTYATGKSGTSMSAAIVAGAAALIRSKYPDLPVHEVWNRLNATAVDKGPAGFDTGYGNGLLDLTAALTRQVAPTPKPRSMASPTPASPCRSTPSNAPPGTAIRSPVRCATGSCSGAAQPI